MNEEESMAYDSARSALRSGLLPFLAIFWARALPLKFSIETGVPEKEIFRS